MEPIKNTSAALRGAGRRRKDEGGGEELPTE